MKVLCLIGKAGSGKDTAADFLVEKDWVKVSFADEIKRTAARWYGFTEHQLWGPSEARNTPSPWYPELICRDVLQKMGTEVGRTIYEDTWINYVFRNVAPLVFAEDAYGDAKFQYDRTVGMKLCGYGGKVPKGIVIPDGRFVNEAEKVVMRGGKCFGILREGAGLTGEAAKHASETEQSSIDPSLFMNVIHNNGSLQDLERVVLSAAEELERSGWTT